MSEILNQTFAAGNSAFTATDVYDQGTNGADPLYPFIYGAEAVTVNGANQMDWSGSYSDYQGAGAWWKGFGPLAGGKFNANAGSIAVRYQPNATSLGAANEAVLAAIPNYVGNSARLYVAWNGQGDNLLKVEFETWTSGVSDTAPLSFTAGQTYDVRVSWQCATIIGDWDDVATDGWVKVYVNGTLVYDSGLVQFFLSQDFLDPYNAADGLWIGYFGLLGPVSSILLTDSTAATPAALPIATPAAPQTKCTPQTQTTNGGKGKAGCNTGGVGWVRSYVGPWGTVPQHANPAAGETLTGKANVEVWTELVHTDYPSGTKTTYRQAMVPLADDPTYHGGYKKEGLVAVGAIEHALGNERGGLEAATVDIEYSDVPDKQYRLLLASQELAGDEVRVKAASDTARAAGTAPMVLMRAVVERPRLQSTQRASIQAVDALFAVGGPLGPDAKFPGRTYGDLGRGAPQMTADTKLTPIVPPYGELSDEGARDPITNEINPKGKIPGVYLGKFSLSGLAAPAATTGRTLAAAVALMQGLVDTNATNATWASTLGFDIGSNDIATLKAMGTVPGTYDRLGSVIGYADLDAVLAQGTTPAPTDGEWGILAFGYGPVYAWLSVFGSDLGGGNPENQHDRTKLDYRARAGSDLLVPGDGVCPWTSFDVTNPDTGEVFALAAIGVRGPLLDDHITGVVTIAANLIGLEHVGDGTGLPIGLGFPAWQHCLENFVLAGKTGGPWVTTSTAPKWDDGTPKVNSDSFAQLQARSAVSLGRDGIYAGWYQDVQVPTTQLQAQLMAWTESKAGISRHGQFKVFALDETVDTSTWRRIEHVTDVFGQVEITFGEERETSCEGVADWDPDFSAFRIAPIKEPSSSGYTRYKNRHKPGALMENGLLTDDTQLRWILQRRLARLQHGTTLVTVIGKEEWLDLDVGDGVLLTTEEGTGASGYEDRACAILRRRYDVARRLVTLTLWDVDDVMIATAETNGLSRLGTVSDDDADAMVVSDDETDAPLVLA